MIKAVNKFATYIALILLSALPLSVDVIKVAMEKADSETTVKTKNLDELRRG